MSDDELLAFCGFDAATLTPVLRERLLAGLDRRRALFEKMRQVEAHDADPEHVSLPPGVMACGHRECGCTPRHTGGEVEL